MPRSPFESFEHDAFGAPGQDDVDERSILGGGRACQACSARPGEQGFDRVLDMVEQGCARILTDLR